ncbi:prosaposin isoform X1 [Wyeomyia smithii]|uniref:prosaposin isoform X1 n=1 Tax=Wyeomyia smithii TaxID=174621 RepID=UPI002467AF16|nr:prosaposin isoform X1 [Wyeomyia smithii]
MNGLLFALASVLLVAASVWASPVETSGQQQLGAKECTWGPSYWCSNLKNAKGCNAVSHCIQTVWEKQTYPVDNDEICNICLDMVKQARDQLESNETQADLKAVFEGSCNLIPIKVVKKECKRLADDFIPELVEALASQMNPNVVCSVAGLCNNAAIDKMLEEMPAVKPMDEDDVDVQPELVTDASEQEFSCNKCNNIAELISNRFHSSDRDQVLEGFLRFCGQMGSFSDGCSSIVLSYFADIYDHMTKQLNAKNICHMSGACADQYHQHEESENIEVRPMGGVGVIKVDGGDDIPCKLCEQLVDHLRDVLIANTTELEFKQVLEGLCKQTKSFSKECLSLVDQYYEEIYNTLVHNLNSNDACFMIGVCPKGLGAASTGPIMPIVPIKVAIMHDQSVAEQKDAPKKLLGDDEPKLSAVEVQQAQLPIDRLMGAPLSLQLVENGRFCTICEYFMHFVQEALSEPANEDEIKRVVSSSCDHLPKAMSGECRTFIDMYGDAVIALLIQSIDPREVCPQLRMCPAANEDIEIFSPAEIDVTIDANAGKDKPTCPLCLFAVTQLEESIKNGRTKENIKQALSKLCSHLSPKLKLECTDFVDTYSSELVEMLVSDFTPQEICVYLKLCVDQRPDLSLLNMEFERENRHQLKHFDVETNEIPDITVNGQITVDHQSGVSTPECLVCEEMVKEVEKRVKNKKNKEQIKEALEHACDRLRKYKTKCERYVEQHSDQIVDLLMRQLTPKEICRTLGFCIAKEIDELEVDEALLDYVVEPVVAEPPKELLSPIEVKDNQPPQCAICEFVMVKLESELADKKTEQDIENAVRSICSKLPNTVTKQCDHLIDQYGQFIIKFLATVPPKEICTRLALCQKQLQLLEDSSLEIIECAVCQGAVEAVDKIIANEKIDHDIVQDVEKICNTVPAKFYEKCEKMIAVYGISMVRQLQNYVEKEQVCVNMGMCSSPTDFVRFEDEVEKKDRVEKKQAYLVGKQECTWGPQHWCASEENAQKCNASKFCSEKKLGKWQQ